MSYTFNLTKQEIITRALQLINEIDINTVPDADDYAFASDILNMMLKTWEVKGIKLWLRKEAVLFPQYQQVSYQIGSVSGADNVSNTFAATEVSSLSSTTLIVDDTEGFEIGMNIGIQLDDMTREWTTITNIVGTTITLNSAMSDTAAEGNSVVAYTDKINRPLRILRGTMLDLTNLSETTTQDISYDEYFDMPIKTNLGTIINFYYDRLINNNLPYTGTLYVYNAPQFVYQLFKFTYLDSIADAINTSDTLNLPQEWLQTIVYNLASELCIPYGKEAQLQLLQPKSEQLLAILENQDTDDQSMAIKFNTTWRPHV